MYPGMQALAWLKLQYWDQQRETLGNVRLELKAKLVEHSLLVVDILDPRATPADPQQSEDELESDSKEEEEVLQAVAQQTLRGSRLLASFTLLPFMLLNSCVCLDRFVMRLSVLYCCLSTQYRF